MVDTRGASSVVVSTWSCHAAGPGFDPLSRYKTDKIRGGEGGGREGVRHKQVCTRVNSEGFDKLPPDPVCPQQGIEPWQARRVGIPTSPFLILIIIMIIITMKIILMIIIMIIIIMIMMMIILIIIMMMIIIMIIIIMIIIML